MKLAIDAKWYFSGPPSGVNVVKNIVDSLISNKENFELLLILNKKDLNSNTEFKQKIKDLNIGLISINSNFNFFKNLFLINKELKKHKIDIVLFQNFIPFFRSKKIIYVNYVHDFLFLDYPIFFSKKERLIYTFIKHSAKKADHIITISQTEKNRIIRHLNLSDSDVSFVYHGIDNSFVPSTQLQKEIIKDKFNLPDKYILYVGRVNVRKNLEILLDANILLKKKYKIVIIGASDNDNGLVNRIKLDFKNDVIIMGHLSQDDLSGVLAAAKVLVFPSLAEGFGLPPIEAMKSGVPVIVSNIEVHKEICSSSALYFNPFSAKDLVEKIETIFENSKENERHINLGKKRAEIFQWEKAVNKISSILKNIYVDSKSN